MIKNSVVLVPFPFDDFSSLRVRPALCLTHEIGKFHHVIIAFISSRIPEDLQEIDLIVKARNAGFVGTALAVDSVIRLHKIVTIPKSLISRKLGSINTSMDVKIRQKIRQLLYF